MKSGINRGKFVKNGENGFWAPPLDEYSWYTSYKILTKVLLENLICSYGISFSWKILCVLTKFWTRSHGKLVLFLWHFFLLENLMCSNEILDKISWKTWSVLIMFFFLLENRMCSYGILRKLSRKFWCVLVHLLENLHVFLHHFWFSWKIWCVLLKESCILLENSYVFLLHQSLPES